MQAAMYLAPSSLPLVKPSKTLLLNSSSGNIKSSIQRLKTLEYCQCPRPPIKVIAALPNDSSSTVDYTSLTSVFPAEACETIGGEACDAEMYPEVKLKPESKLKTPSSPTTTITTMNSTSSSESDTDYLDYNTPKTVGMTIVNRVFPGEACDDLGGEFCEPEYQTGVF